MREIRTSGSVGGPRQAFVLAWAYPDSLAPRSIHRDSAIETIPFREDTSLRRSTASPARPTPSQPTTPLSERQRPCAREAWDWGK